MHASSVRWRTHKAFFSKRVTAQIEVPQARTVQPGRRRCPWRRMAPKHRKNLMIRFESIRPWLAALLAGALCACGGGGGGRDPVLGFEGAPNPVPPAETAVAPINNATGVPIHSTSSTAAFNEPM